MVRIREVAMRSDRVLGTIDFHTAGIGMRLLTSGLGRLPGKTIGEKRRWYQERLDHLRTGLCLEPRGHRALLIAVMTEPVTPGAHFGLFFIHPGGYYVSCGEGTIEVPVDIAVGVGNVFAIVEAHHLGLAVRRELAKRIAQRGTAVREAVNAQLRVDVPGLGKTSVEMVLVHELPDAAGVSPNALVWGPGQVDAAPCGSGTCARMALFHHRGLMRVGSTFISRGLLGLDFAGRIAGETDIEGRRAILPEITGTAYLTGMTQFLFDPEDPVRAGYLLEV